MFRYKNQCLQLNQCKDVTYYYQPLLSVFGYFFVEIKKYQALLNWESRTKNSISKSFSQDDFLRFCVKPFKSYSSFANKSGDDTINFFCLFKYEGIFLSFANSSIIIIKHKTISYKIWFVHTTVYIYTQFKRCISFTLYILEGLYLIEMCFIHIKCWYVLCEILTQPNHFWYFFLFFM